jgi:hypothetical protein
MVTDFSEAKREGKSYGGNHGNGTLKKPTTFSITQKYFGT